MDRTTAGPADSTAALAGTPQLDLLKALGDNTRYAIYLELARSPRPLATADISESLGLHPNTVRPHLERMREAGLLDVDEPIYVGNVYLDRSGKEKEPYVTLEEFDPTLTDQVDTWITDVVYAVQHDEEASKDIAPAVCEQICEFFTVCRGSMPDTHDPMLILDGEQKDAIRMYVEARDMAKEADKMKRAAQAHLVGVEGSDGEWQVRWTHIPESEVASFRKNGYDRMDIRKVRKQSREGL